MASKLSGFNDPNLVHKFISVSTPLNRSFPVFTDVDANSIDILIQELAQYNPVSDQIEIDVCAVAPGLATFRMLKTIRVVSIE
jgi:hypothetical protein